tara:strand:- start:596 stop:922 length:327 start_codon:yes stop_codon:yes gene_type:complete
MKISPIGASSWLGKYHVVLTAYPLLPGRTRVERPITVDPADGLRGEVGSVVVLVDVFSVAVVPVVEDEWVSDGPCSVGSASAGGGQLAKATPIPKATAHAPIRSIYLL